MLSNQLYLEDLKRINEAELPWEELENCKILVTGGTGLIGSCLVDALIYRNEYLNAGMDIWVLCRKKERAQQVFSNYLDKPYFHMIYQDVSEPIILEGDMDYIVHAASKGNPKSFVSDPLGIMQANLLGMHRILDYAQDKQMKKIVYISSGEVYGKLELQESETITESMMGSLDTMNPRNCYGMSKRAAETMCAAANDQQGIPTVVARLCHIYGPTMMTDENRVIFQFVQNVLDGQDIVMKSAGLQRRSYCYVTDAVKGILTIMLKGHSGEAYNVANSEAVVSIRGLAECIADIGGQKIVAQTQDAVEQKGNSGIMHAVLDDRKLRALGCMCDYRIAEGIARMIAILKK